MKLVKLDVVIKEIHVKHITLDNMRRFQALGFKVKIV